MDNAQESKIKWNEILLHLLLWKEKLCDIQEVQSDKTSKPG